MTRTAYPVNNIQGENGPPRKWFVLPGLRETVDRYIYMIRTYFDQSESNSERDKPIMIVGDSGVGKSLFIQIAKSIFLKSNNTTKKTARLNCATFDGNLAISEIFGHEKGAYTGAISDKKGIVEEYKDGLLFLDEIGELQKDIQAKLLVFIEDGEYRRLGSNKVLNSKLKIIGTTNKSEIDFRSDFWFRFNVIFIPPLFKRRHDVLYYILLKYPEIFQKLNPLLTTCLLAHHWPGNTREIERVISSIAYRLQRNNNVDINDNTPNAHYNEDSRYSSLSTGAARRLGSDLLNASFDVLTLNNHLMKHGIIVPFFFKSLSKAHLKNFNDAYFDMDDEELNAYNYQTKLSTAIASEGHEFLEQDGDYNPLKEQLEVMFCLLKRKINYNKRGRSAKKKMYFKNACHLTINPYSDDLEYVYKISHNGIIENAFSALLALCNLLSLDPNADTNIFTSKTSRHFEYRIDSKVEIDLLSAFNSSGLIVSDKTYHTTTEKGRELSTTHLHVESTKTIDEQNANIINHHTKQSFKNKNEEQLLVSYYTWLIENSNSLKEAAHKSGLNYNTFRSKLRKYKITNSKMKMTDCG